MVMQSPILGNEENHKDADRRPGVAIGSRLRLYLDCEYDISACESLPDVLAIIEQDAALKYYPERKALWLLNELKTRGLNPDWLDGFKFGWSRKLKRDYPCEASDYYTWLMPYSHVVTDEQFLQALADGLTVFEIHDRLLGAECAIVEACDSEAWNTGWDSGCEGLAWIPTTYDTDSETHPGDMLEKIDDAMDGLRKACYQSYLAGIPWQGQAELETWRGRRAAFDAARPLIGDDFDPSGEDLKDAAKTLQDITSLRSIAASDGRRRTAVNNEIATFSNFGDSAKIGKSAQNLANHETDFEAQILDACDMALLRGAL